MVHFIRRHAWWLVPLIIADLFLFRWILSRSPDVVQEAATTPEEPPSDSVPQEPPGLVYGYPTDQRDLWNTESTAVFQPTAAGRVESALYGTVRTRSFGGKLLPAFHEGIDIAPIDRDRRGRPRDEIYAVADGRVTYINRVAGNSTYGIYVVLVHDDPVGEIYTLYSHLARVPGDLAVGQMVERGETIGVMGNTMSSGLPMVRAHLHFEIGMIKNQGFRSWYRKQKLIPDHGNYHGHNLTGIDPLAVFGAPDAEGPFSMRAYLKTCPPAVTLVFHARKPLDYFERYPALWTGGAFHPGPVRVTVSEGGVLLSGRMATPEEAGDTSEAQVRVLEVDDAVLGRNGLRLVVPRNGEWVFGRNGERWLEILTY